MIKAEFNPQRESAKRPCPLWVDAKEIETTLICDGWFSPDTYSNVFEPVISGPAVYLFLVHETETYAEAIIAYVGMSTRLSHRLSNHNILPSLHVPGYWPMRWFKPVDPDLLRETERAYIERFDPPWNIVGKTRGVPLT